MLKEQLSMVTVHDAFISYMLDKGGQVEAVTGEWKKFKQYLLTRMQTESAKKHG